MLICQDLKVHICVFLLCVEVEVYVNHEESRAAVI